MERRYEREEGRGREDGIETKYKYKAKLYSQDK